eukprot:SAG31_NODE_13515_length_864_cov_1.124183_1_plen_223_part_10
MDVLLVLRRRRIRTVARTVDIIYRQHTVQSVRRSQAHFCTLRTFRFVSSDTVARTVADVGGLGDGDTSYEIAICYWGLSTVLQLVTELGIEDPRAAAWQDRLDKLADFTTDPEFGLNVAKGLPFEQPHRHFSHLMGAVLKDPRLATVDGLALVNKSLDHWRSLRDPCQLPLPRAATRSQGPISDAGWTGFSYAVSALLHARLQRPQQAMEDVVYMVENSIVDG